MRKFEEVKKELVLFEPSGTTDFIGDRYDTNYYKNKNQFVVKHFGGVLTSAQVRTYADIIISFAKWLEKSGLTKYLYVEQPSEIGADFIAIPYDDHLFFKSIRELYGGEKSRDVKESYEKALLPIKAAVQQMSNTSKEVILKEIIERSVLNHSWETYYNMRWNKIVVFEPNILKEDILEWDLSV